MALIAWLLCHFSLLYFLMILTLSPTKTNCSNTTMLITSHIDSVGESLTKQLIKIPFRNLLKPHFRTKTTSREATYLERERYKGTPENIDPENRISEDGKGLSTMPLYPRSFGAHTVNLGFGKPKQPIPLIMDTGSNLVWVPCTSHYKCSDCSFPNITLPSTPNFNPTGSFVQSIPCKSSMCHSIHRNKKPKCKLLFGKCPGYEFTYASWTTEGISLGNIVGQAVKQNMENSVHDFVVTCTKSSTHLPLGRVGFGSSPESLPSQMGVHKFSFCLLSHYYDDTFRHSFLVLNDDLVYHDLSYTPLIRNPITPIDAHFYGYRYVNLEEIVVGDYRIRIPIEEKLPNKDGNGGTIIDTGIPFTFLGRSVFGEVADEFENQMGDYERAPDQGVLGPCFSLVGTDINSAPRLSFVFEGGARMDFPVTNYFLYDDKENVLCLSLTTDIIGGQAPNVALSGGPNIIIGNYLLMNFHLEFDLKLGRLGFKQEDCD